MGSDCLVGVEFPFAVMKMSKLQREVVTQHSDCAKRHRIVHFIALLFFFFQRLFIFGAERDRA